MDKNEQLLCFFRARFSSGPQSAAAEGTALAGSSAETATNRQLRKGQAPANDWHALSLLHEPVLDPECREHAERGRSQRPQCQSRGQSLRVAHPARAPITPHKEARENDGRVGC